MRDGVPLIVRRTRRTPAPSLESGRFVGETHRASSPFSVRRSGPAIHSRAAAVVARLISAGVTIAGAGWVAWWPISARRFVSGAYSIASGLRRTLGGRSYRAPTRQNTGRSLITNPEDDGGAVATTHDRRGKCRTWKYQALRCTSSLKSVADNFGDQPCPSRAAASAGSAVVAASPFGPVISCGRAMRGIWSKPWGGGSTTSPERVSRIQATIRSFVEMVRQAAHARYRQSSPGSDDGAGSIPNSCRCGAASFSISEARRLSMPGPPIAVRPLYSSCAQPIPLLVR